MTADFQRVYGIRLRDAVLDRSPEEIEELLIWLPSESAFRASFLAKGNLRQAQARWSWSTDQELMLNLMNLIIVQTHTISQSQSPKKIKFPKLIDSPRGKKPNGKRRDADSQARSMLAAIKARKAG